MSSSKNLGLRDSRDRIVDLLGLGETYPLREVSLTAELKVPFGANARLIADPSQAHVRYELRDHNGDGPPERPEAPLERLDGDGVVFTDGTREKVDAIVWATGYNVTFPFLKQPELTPQDNTFPLYKRIVKPGFETLFFLGLAQPLPTLVNFAEQQSKLVAAALTGDYGFPNAAEMARITLADEQEHLGHFYDSPRHRMQVDFGVYVADLLKELMRGAKRAGVVA